MQPPADLVRRMMLTVTLTPRACLQQHCTLLQQSGEVLNALQSIARAVSQAIVLRNAGDISSTGDASPAVTFRNRPVVNAADDIGDDAALPEAWQTGLVGFVKLSACALRANYAEICIRDSNLSSGPSSGPPSVHAGTSGGSTAGVGGREHKLLAALHPHTAPAPSPRNGSQPAADSAGTQQADNAFPPADTSIALSPMASSVRREDTNAGTASSSSSSADEASHQQNAGGRAGAMDASFGAGGGAPAPASLEMQWHEASAATRALCSAAGQFSQQVIWMMPHDMAARGITQWQSAAILQLSLPVGEARRRSDSHASLSGIGNSNNLSGGSGLLASSGASVGTGSSRPAGIHAVALLYWTEPSECCGTLDGTQFLTMIAGAARSCAGLAPPASDRWYPYPPSTTASSPSVGFPSPRGLGIGGPAGVGVGQRAGALVHEASAGNRSVDSGRDRSRSGSGSGSALSGSQHSRATPVTAAALDSNASPAVSGSAAGPAAAGSDGGGGATGVPSDHHDDEHANQHQQQPLSAIPASLRKRLSSGVLKRLGSRENLSMRARGSKDHLPSLAGSGTGTGGTGGDHEHADAMDGSGADGTGSGNASSASMPRPQSGLDLLAAIGADSDGDDGGGAGGDDAGRGSRKRSVDDRDSANSGGGGSIPGAADVRLSSTAQQPEQDNAGAFAVSMDDVSQQEQQPPHHDNETGEDAMSKRARLTSGHWEGYEALSGMAMQARLAVQQQQQQQQGHIVPPQQYAYGQQQQQYGYAPYQQQQYPPQYLPQVYPPQQQQQYDGRTMYQFQRGGAGTGTGVGTGPYGSIGMGMSNMAGSGNGVAGGDASSDQLQQQQYAAAPPLTAFLTAPGPASSAATAGVGGAMMPSMQQLQHHQQLHLQPAMMPGPSDNMDDDGAQFEDHAGGGSAADRGAGDDDEDAGDGSGEDDTTGTGSATSADGGYKPKGSPPADGASSAASSAGGGNAGRKRGRHRRRGGRYVNAPYSLKEADYMQMTAAGLPAVSAAALARVKGRSRAPKPKLSVALRRGKWPPEEEDFTSVIVDTFRAGVLPLPEGTTLRTYLSGQLHCAPMRITKKFAKDDSIGKQVYKEDTLLKAQDESEFERRSAEAQASVMAARSRFHAAVKAKHSVDLAMIVPDPFEAREAREHVYDSEEDEEEGDLEEGEASGEYDGARMHHHHHHHQQQHGEMDDDELVGQADDVGGDGSAASAGGFAVDHHSSASASSAAGTGQAAGGADDAGASKGKATRKRKSGAADAKSTSPQGSAAAAAAASPASAPASTRTGTRSRGAQGARLLDSAAAVAASTPSPPMYGGGGADMNPSIASMTAATSMGANLYQLPMQGYPSHAPTYAAASSVQQQQPMMQGGQHQYTMQQPAGIYAYRPSGPSSLPVSHAGHGIPMPMATMQMMYPPTSAAAASSGSGAAGGAAAPSSASKPPIPVPADMYLSAFLAGPTAASSSMTNVDAMAMAGPSPARRDNHHPHNHHHVFGSLSSMANGLREAGGSGASLRSLAGNADLSGMPAFSDMSPSASSMAMHRNNSMLGIGLGIGMGLHPSASATSLMGSLDGGGNSSGQAHGAAGVDGGVLGRGRRGTAAGQHRSSRGLGSMAGSALSLASMGDADAAAGVGMSTERSTDSPGPRNNGGRVSRSSGAHGT